MGHLLGQWTLDRYFAGAVGPLLASTPQRAAQLDGLRAMRAELAPEGSPPAARRAAEEVLALLEARAP